MEYTYSLDEEYWMDYDTIVDLVSHDYDEGIKVKVFKGEQHPMRHDQFVDADRIIEDIEERAWDEGGEYFTMLRM